MRVTTSKRNVACWHEWYAWRPIRFTTYENCRIVRTWIWREKMWRRKPYFFWEYSLEKPDPIEFDDNDEAEE